MDKNILVSMNARRGATSLFMLSFSLVIALLPLVSAFPEDRIRPLVGGIKVGAHSTPFGPYVVASHANWVEDELGVHVLTVYGPSQLSPPGVSGGG